MRLKATADLAKGNAQLDRLAAGIRKAKARAANELRKQARTAGLRAVNDAYSIGPRTMEQYVTETVATPEEPTAALTVKGKRLPMSAFKPIVRRGKGGGVSVLIKGRRVLIRHAFIGQFGQVVARGAYQGRKAIRPRGDRFQGFAFGKGRLPVSALQGISAAEAFGARVVVDAMNNRIDEQAAAVLRRELDAVARGF